MASIDKSTLRRVQHLGRPESVYKSNVEMPFLGFEMAVWPWRSRLMTPVCYTSQANLTLRIRCKFDDFSSDPFKVIVRTSQISKILSRNGQNAFEAQGQWPLFSIPDMSIAWCISGAIWWFQWRVIFTDKQNFPRILSQNGLIKYWTILKECCMDWILKDPLLYVLCCGRGFIF